MQVIENHQSDIDIIPINAGNKQKKLFCDFINLDISKENYRIDKYFEKYLMLYNDDTATDRYTLNKKLITTTFIESKVASFIKSSITKLIERRVDELKLFAEDDGEQPPLEDSKQLMSDFFAVFKVKKMPEITLTDDGNLYIRIFKGKNKLVVCFLSNRHVQYLIESKYGYLENISTFDFFREQHTKFVNELILND